LIVRIKNHNVAFVTLDDVTTAMPPTSDVTAETDDVGVGASSAADVERRRSEANRRRRLRAAGPARNDQDKVPATAKLHFRILLKVTCSSPKDHPY